MSSIKSPRNIRVRTHIALVRAIPLTFLLFGNLAPAQDEPPTTPADATTSQESLQAALEKAEQADLPEDVKSTTVESFKSAIDWTQKASELKKAAANFKKQTETARDAEDLKQELATELPPRSFDAIDTSAKAAEELQKVESDLTNARLELQNIEEAPLKRSQRRTEIPKELASAKERLAQIEKSLPAASQTDEPDLLRQAKRDALLAEKAFLNNKIEAMNLELEYYTRTNDTLNLQRDLLVRQVARLEDEQERLQKFQLDLEKQAAQAKQREAEQLARLEAVRSIPALQKMADRNKELAQLRTSWTSELDDTRTRLKSAQEQHRTIESEFKQIEQRVETAGLTNAVGLLLRQKQAMLPSTNSFQRRLRQLQPRLVDAILLRQDLSDERAELASIDTQVDRILATTETTLTGEQEATARNQASELLTAKRDNLDQLIGTVEGIQVALTDLDTTLRELIRETSAFSKYISERILWVASAKTLSFDTLVQAYQESVWLLSWTNWKQVYLDAAATPIRSGILVGSFILLFALAILFRTVATRTLNQAGEAVRARFLDSLQESVRATIFTFLASTVVPLAVAVVGVILANAGAATLPTNLGRSLLDIAFLVWCFEFVILTLRPLGLAEAHFRWTSQTVLPLRKRVRVFRLIGLPLAFFFRFAEENRVSTQNDSLERVIYLVAIAVAAVFFARTLHPTRGLIAQRFAKEDERLIYRSRYAIFALSLLVPVSLIGLECMGYHYTAVALTRKVGVSLLLIGLYLFAYELTLRVLLVFHGRLARQRAQKRREELIAKRKEEGDDTSLPAVKEENAVDLYTINAQTRTLFNGILVVVTAALLWFAWADVLPAFTFLDQFNVLTLQKIDVESGERSLSVGVALTAILLVVATVVLYRNVDGLLQLLVLQRLSVEQGTQYAITTISKYAVGVVGLVAVASEIGLEWSQIQWLVAAASVGIGFGLQEIVANFVSGLILLIERPVRVGDIVTIDGTTGVVARIRMRATTVTNWDRQDLVVPNKDFITGRILNWSLSNAINRVVVHVGVAYGTDVEHAKNVLHKVVGQNSMVLEDPSPIITFEGFGDSTLNLVVRCFLGELENRLAVIDALHSAINEAFQKEGIEIAFPQRDLHVRSLPAEMTQKSESNGADRSASKTKSKSGIVDSNDDATADVG